MCSRQRNGEETVDHRVDLPAHLQLAEVPGTHGLAVQNIGEHLVETRHVRTRLELVGRYVDTRYRQTSGRLGGIVVAQAFESRHHHVPRRGGHAPEYALLAPLV